MSRSASSLKYPYRAWVHHYERGVVEVTILGPDWYDQEGNIDGPERGDIYYMFEDGLITRTTLDEVYPSRYDCLRKLVDRLIGEQKSRQKLVEEKEAQLNKLVAYLEEIRPGSCPDCFIADSINKCLEHDELQPRPH